MYVKYGKERIKAHPELEKKCQRMSVLLDSLMVSKQVSKLLNKKLVEAVSEMKSTDTVTLETINVPDGVEVLMMCPKGREDEDLPCLVYYHGGGFQLRETPYIIRYCMQYCEACNCRVAFVKYSDSISKPYPLPLLECMDAYRHLYEHSNDYKIDRDNMGLGGDSAGGYFATAVTVNLGMNQIQPKFVLLVYPTVDAKSQCKSIKTFYRAPLWGGWKTKKVWKNFLRKGKNWTRACDRLEQNYTDLFSLDMSNFPDTYIEVNEIDSLRDEGIELIKKLKASGVDVTYVINFGCFHGFDVDEKLEVAKNAVARRCDYMKEGFMR